MEISLSQSKSSVAESAWWFVPVNCASNNLLPKLEPWIGQRSRSAVGVWVDASSSKTWTVCLVCTCKTNYCLLLPVPPYCPQTLPHFARTSHSASRWIHVRTLHSDATSLTLWRQRLLKILSLPSQMHTRLYTANSPLCCVWRTRVTHGN